MPIQKAMFCSIAVLGLLAVAAQVLPQFTRSKGGVTTAGDQTSHDHSQPGGDSVVVRGRLLFQHNCASCHGEDARGDEGPDLHRVKKSDARLAGLIRGGVKGEMPAFGRKFPDQDVQALVAFLRTLRE